MAEPTKDQRLVFKYGDDIDVMLASIYGTIGDGEIDKLLPYKDSYGTILLFKYSKTNTDVYDMMHFIRNDIRNFLPKDNKAELRHFNKAQIDCLQKFMKLMKLDDITTNEVCAEVWDSLSHTFNFYSHERFNLQEVTLFNMCCDLVDKKLGTIPTVAIESAAETKVDVAAKIEVKSVVEPVAA